MKRSGFLLGCIILVCGLMWSNLALSIECPPNEDCKELIVLAKRAELLHIDCFECSKKCTEEKNCDDIIIRMKGRVSLNPKETLCDEALQCIPLNSQADVDLTYHIKRVGPCGKPVGTHEGKFKIYSGNTGQRIASGKMKGTNGLDTHATSGECCFWPHDEGCMESKNVKCGEKGTCKLIATYTSNLPNMPNNPIVDELCDSSKWTGWTLAIDGILLCECEETDHD